MIVHNFNIVGIAVFECETQAVLVIYPDRPLARSIIFKRVQLVPGRNAHVINMFRHIQLIKFA